MIRVLIAYPSPLVSAGLRVALAAHADLQIVQDSEIYDGEDEVDLPGADVLVTDCDSGVQRGSPAGRKGCRVLILTLDESEAGIRRAIEAGAHGYLLMTSQLEAIVQAVRSIYRGGTAFDPTVAAKMMNGLRYPRLTHREHDVLRLLLLGLSNKVLAARMGISPETIKTHVKALLRKLNATNRSHAVSVARQRGLVQELDARGSIHNPTTGRRRIAGTAGRTGDSKDSSRPHCQ